MREAQITSLFRIRRRFLRSVHLERDFADSQALDGYVVTPQTRNHLERLASGLRETSGQRAWRITGDYGSGKSSFALFLAHVLAERGASLPGQLRNAVDFRKLGVPRPNLLPVLVTGSAEPIGVAVLRAITREVAMVSGRGRTPSVVERMHLEIKQSASRAISDNTVVELIREASEYVVGAGKATGLLIVLDELGKFLEYGALHPERQDVYLLQALGEAASRSGEKPLFIVGLLHQGFHAYAEHLTQAGQKEWEKVAGRFDELLFDQALDHTATLIADALNIQTQGVPKEVRTRARRDMSAILELGWYGASAPGDHLLGLAERLYPLHPSVLPVLAKLFRRFGQNERSLFSFLLSNEPFGLQEFASRAVRGGEFYRIHNLYDYARSAFGYRLGLQSFRSHWNHIESIIESFPAENKTELEVLKTLGLLNVIDSIPLVGTEEVLGICVQSGADGSSVQGSVRRLRSRRVVYHRGVAGGLCLWPHTSVNLEKAYEEASRALGESPDRVAPLIQKYLETRPVVARRHYIETGNLRHFEVVFSPVSELPDAFRPNCEAADGHIVVALCETEEEREQAVRIAASEGWRNEAAVLCAIPNPLRALGKLLQEVRRWEWVVANTNELHNDLFATEEVTRQLLHARDALAARINGFVGLHQFGGSELTWYRKGQRIPVKSGREFLAYVSDVCDELYPSAPRFFNELINRRTLSSAAAKARTRLVEGIFARSTEPSLGMDRTKKPPEMSMYLSLLEGPGIHRKVGEGWGLRIPSSANDSCNVRPALDRIREILTASSMRRVPVSEILGELRKPPFGIRDGLSPFLIAIFAVVNEHHVAFYENEKFMREMAGLDLVRLTKLPENFEMQFCKVAGIRSELFSRLLKVLDLNSSPAEVRSDVLDIVRPLCVFAARLPSYTLKTRKLSAHAVAVRDVLLGAREPAVLLFRELPHALGFAEFTSDSGGSRQGGDIEAFVQELKKSLDELRMNYSLLQGRMMTTIAIAFNVTESTGNLRRILAKRAQTVLMAITEIRLKAFCNRLLDLQMPEPEWLDSLGSLVTGVPLTRWTDSDVDGYDQELSQLCERFRRVESIAFQMQSPSASGSALRVVITRLDGSELDQVVHVNPEDDDQAFQVEADVSALLKDSKAGSLAGALRAFWKALDAKDVSNA
jgi:hypothetical protein